MDNVITESEPKNRIMLLSKPNKTMHNVIKEIKPNNAKCYQRTQTKGSIMLSRKSNQTMHNAIRNIKPNDA